MSLQLHPFEQSVYDAAQAQFTDIVSIGHKSAYDSGSSGTAGVAINGADVTGAKYAFYLRKLSKDALLVGAKVRDWKLWNSPHGQAVLTDDGVTNVYIRSLDCDLGLPPEAGYSRNIDGITLDAGNAENGAAFVRDSVIKGTTDASMDCKFTAYLDNVVLNGGSRLLRVWTTTVFVANSNLIMPSGGNHMLELLNSDSHAVFYNTRFESANGTIHAQIPDDLIKVDNGGLRANVTYLTSAPSWLDHPFFTEGGSTVPGPEPTPPPYDDTELRVLIAENGLEIEKINAKLADMKAVL